MIVALLFLFTRPAHAQEEKITSFDASYSIQDDGSVDVVEKITYDFGSAYKHGIYRTIPFVKTNNEGKKFKMDISNISVTDEDYQDLQFSKTQTSSDITLKIGDPNTTINGEHMYVISYRVRGALTYFSDHDEFYWNVTGNGWQVPIDEATSTVGFANDKNASLESVCFSGPTGETAQNCEVLNQANSTTSSVHQLLPYEGLTIAVKFPPNLVVHLEPEPVIIFFDTVLGKIVALILFVLAIIWYILLPISIIVKWYVDGRDPDVGLDVTAYFDPPVGKNNKKLTPGETGALIDEVVDFADITATLVDLACRGFLVIEEREKNDFYAVKKNTAKQGEVSDFELTLLSALFEGRDEVRFKDVKLVKTVQSMQKQLYEGMVRNSFFAKNPNSTRLLYSVIGSIALLTFNFPLGIIAFIFGYAMPKKTLSGALAAQKARGLRNFLRSQERQLNFQGDKQMFFEKLLPFAVAFGVEKNWIKRFSEVDLRQPTWYVSSTNTAFNAAVFQRSLNSSLSSFRSSATPTSSSSGFSSGFSGGSSGGGGGGGGGGSW